MAMLAAPRRKQKVINLRAKNNEWSNDTNKFGQRMLEKMGWSSGKGLGAKENGMVEHVVARYKNDERGLGFEDKNDQWTKHEDDFNALLANLSNGDANEEKLHSGVSLEVKSKKSKARVHYHKFTRGKDLTRYSEKDLANIFGKKTLKNKVNKEEKLMDEVEVSNSEQVFTEKGSMEDYFKSKMKALTSKSNQLLTDSRQTEDVEADYGFKGFSGATNDSPEDQSGGSQSFSFYSPPLTTNLEGDSVVGETDNKQKKKKKKKSKVLDEETVQPPCDNELENECTAITNNSDEIPRKKSKKKKHKLPSEEKCELEQSNDIAVDETVPEDVTHAPKKKKKKKNKHNEIL